MPSGIYLRTEKHKKNWFKKGIIPWNKDTKGICKSNSGSFKKGIIPWIKGKHLIAWNKGLKGSIKPNKTSFKKGEHVSQRTEFKKGNISWSKLYPEMMPRGNEHSQWKGGISFIPYPLGWSKTFREQIRYRDGYKCKICDVPEIECKKRLLIHHIDYNKQNINPINLISLCNSCHSKTNWNREYWIKFFDGKIEEVMPKCPQKVL